MAFAVEGTGRGPVPSQQAGCQQPTQLLVQVSLVQSSDDMAGSSCSGPAWTSRVNMSPTSSALMAIALMMVTIRHQTLTV